MKSFILFVFFVITVFSIIYRIRYQVKVPSVMKNNKRIFELMDIDKILLIIPEFCPIKKLMKQAPSDNFEIQDLFRQLIITKYTFIPSFLLMFGYAFLFAERIN